ncbi:MAG: hypothetical protein ABIW84_09400, partial [Ilumatobacteraceae bacterium]
SLPAQDPLPAGDHAGRSNCEPGGTHGPTELTARAGSAPSRRSRGQFDDPGPEQTAELILTPVAADWD